MTKEEIKNRKRLEEDYYLKNKIRLPNNDKEAQRRYEIFMSKDPYPNIDPALLNSADIFDYVAKTGMIYPFDTDKLQGASYEVSIRGTVIWWDENRKENKIQLSKPDDLFKLEPNSIAFVTLEPMFRIPDYIALRFNLKINHIYKGLLLGTGPIVDPGFVGRLSIPLHNLTSNTYIFHAGDGIIQMEFTKLSQNSIWSNKNCNSGLYKRKWIKPKRKLEEYIKRALHGSNDTIIKSSIPEEISKVRKKSEDMQKEIDESKEKIDNKFANIQIINVLTCLPVIVFACTVIYQLGQVNTIKKEQIYELETQYEQLIQKYDSDKEQLYNKIIELENEIKLLQDENKD